MLMERKELATQRIRQIAEEPGLKEPFRSCFEKGAQFLLLLEEAFTLVESRELRKMDLKSLQELNHRLYEDILPKNYEKSFANPSYAVKVCRDAGYDELYGQILSFLHAELRGLIPYVFEQDLEVFVIFMELFIELYDQFSYEEDGVPEAEALRKAIYWFESDNCDILIPKRLEEHLDPSHDFAYRIITECDLSDLRYLYFYGDHIGENEIGLAKLFQDMKREEVEKLASVYTEGYRIGFEKGNKDLSKKEVAEIRYPVGLEAMVKASIEQFAKMGLKVTMKREGTISLNRPASGRVSGFGSTSPNRQYDFDHKDDKALYLDKDFVNRRLSVLKAAFEEKKYLANHHAGPACIEIFGEAPFDAIAKKEALQLSDRQQKLSVEFASQSGRLTNEYIIGKERSFTIISFPCPAIGENFKEIFYETVKVNTLDYQRYERMQQILIDVLDKAKTVHILGKAPNVTDLTVALYDLKDPEKETIFENCVADVNIPVGEVFTSPKLTGTNGLLHVTQVYLDGLKYVDLKVALKDGRVSDYTCKNFKTEEENKKYFKDNVLNHHDFLPLGEFAIGTNTTAFKMAVTYGIQDKMDILIAEKTGPHFALGDTCYSYDEDLVTYNPDGKQIVARDNEITLIRKEDPLKAYFNCHTDITIPYNELAGIWAVDENGDKTAIIEDGLFVLEGLEELNKPLLEMRN